MSEYNGTAWWHTYRNISGFNLVNLAGFSAVNGLSGTQDGPFISLSASANAASSPGILYKTLPSPPFTISACFQSLSNHSAQTAGLVLLSSTTDSSTSSQFLGIFDQSDTQGNAVTAAGNLFFGLVRDLSQNMGGGGLIGSVNGDHFAANTPACVAVSDDGTNRKYGESTDGVRWKAIFTQPHDSSFTNIGVFIDSDGSNTAFTVSWIGWTAYSAAIF